MRVAPGVFTVAVLPRDFGREVDNARASTLRRDTSEAGRVKGLTVIDEVRVVQDIDERRLQFALDSFSDRDALNETRVDIEEPRSVERVNREVTEGTRSRSAEQTRFNNRLLECTGCCRSDVQELRIDEIDTCRMIEDTYVPLELLETNTQQLGRVVTGVELVNRRTVRKDKPRWAGRPNNDRSNGPATDHAIDKSVSVAQVPATSSNRDVVDRVEHEAVSLILVRSHVVQFLVAQSPERGQVALVVAESARRIGQSLAESVISLELETASEPAPDFGLQRVIVGHRVVAQERNTGGVRIRDKEIRGNTQGGILSISHKRRRKGQRVSQRADVVVSQIVD